ncbi:GntR family transcriptional regulator [Marinobacteraceae bacterium S3BR75-40.1]
MEFQVPNTLAEQIANYLAQRIMTGDIRPGERLHEATIAAELQVSRASVKEAFYTLERWHLLEIKPRKGANATQIDAEHANELYDVYMHLLVMLATRLCERWQSGDKDYLLETIGAVTEQLASPAPDIAEAVEGSFAVMEACCQVVCNPYLTEALTNFKPAVSRTFYFCADRYRQDLDRTREFFTTLTQAVLARDAGEARRRVEAFGEHQKYLIRQALSVEMEEV